MQNWALAYNKVAWQSGLGIRPIFCCSLDLWVRAPPHTNFLKHNISLSYKPFKKNIKNAYCVPSTIYEILLLLAIEGGGGMNAKENISVDVNIKSYKRNIKSTSYSSTFNERNLLNTSSSYTKYSFNLIAPTMISKIHKDKRCPVAFLDFLHSLMCFSYWVTPLHTIIV